MTSFISTATLFNQAKFSDITIKFSDKEFKCHKLILCSRSEYFNKLCGPDSHFAKSNRNEIELKEDDPDVLEAVLRYIYDGDPVPKRPDDCLYQLEVAEAANKYLLKELEQAAFQQFCSIAEALNQDTSKVPDSMDKIGKAGVESKQLAVADRLQDKHIRQLLRKPRTVNRARRTPVYTGNVSTASAAPMTQVDLTLPAAPPVLEDSSSALPNPETTAALDVGKVVNQPSVSPSGIPRLWGLLGSWKRSG